ncbi:MAG: hypothetical protein FWE91_10890 [Defluviitaleaceae bacterium]|nr:hypothetical protein [Defluviitaleaceae bacterium]MCL2835180.1 hypothetical protein [Defluviitaleaceae bacterium]
MALADFTEDFRLYSRVIEKSVDGVIRVSWEKGPIFRAAITLSREKEVSGNGTNSVGQIVDVAERYSLYIQRGMDYEIPVFDDFVKRLGDGSTYRILTNPESRVTPDISGLKLQMCGVIKTEMPGGGDGDE